MTIFANCEVITMLFTVGMLHAKRLMYKPHEKSLMQIASFHEDYP